MPFPHLIDNQRIRLAKILCNVAPQHRRLSIATGYWDLPGTLAVVDSLAGYESIRLLIGKEPLPHRLQRAYNIEEEIFPDADIAHDLETAARYSGAKAKTGEIETLRDTVKKIAALLEKGVLKVKVFRQPRLHAKAYIFGSEKSKEAVGIVGSSNFTAAGLTGNAELNALEEDPRTVLFTPQAEGQPHGHLSWFNELWNDKEAIDWTGDFTRILRDSPLGDLCFGQYDVYIKTLMDVFPDELIPPQPLSADTSDVLFAFQNRNAGILINKLERHGLALLADSVGLGKTITAGAVIKHYIGKGKRNIIVIPPASLKEQWKGDLAEKFGLVEGCDFRVFSQQNIDAFQRELDLQNQPYMKNYSADLFVIDEAHNLRNQAASRYKIILDLFLLNPGAKILLLTATPVNNSLMDLSNQIQLAAKGKRVSVNVPYKKSTGDVAMIDFFDALLQIQTRIRRAEREGKSFNFDSVKETVHTGLRNYLVRSTRQGVEAEESMVKKDGGKKTFPKSVPVTIDYKYEAAITDFVSNTIDKVRADLENIDARVLNLDLASECTQQSSHPLEWLPKALDDEAWFLRHFEIDDDTRAKTGPLALRKSVKSVVPNILQVIYLLGFCAYRPEAYKYYGASIAGIRSSISGLKEAEKRKVNVQLAVHNILHITWLKRLESSASALQKSVETYARRLELFAKYLEKGYIVSIGEAELLESGYGEGDDLESAFSDYEAYMREVEAELASGEDTASLKKRGVQRVEADPAVYNIPALRKDIERDRAVLRLLDRLAAEVAKPEHNTKMKMLREHIKKTLAAKQYGKKVIVFSFFADTISFLKNSLPALMADIPDFAQRAEFVSAQGGNAEKAARLFSPRSKKYTPKNGEREIDFLFATDVLSEGQNLQDCGALVNYDLHWNPVRMIQRNGRVNRLGSEYAEVNIGNMKPEENLELYLRLVKRLERKIDTINNTIGNDQSVLGEAPNPIEFIEKYYRDGSLPEPDDALMALSDEHILALRKFLATHPKGSPEFKRVSAMPAGKWNYLPLRAEKKSAALAMMRVKGRTAESGTAFSDTFFVSLKLGDEYVASFIENRLALDRIKCGETDNKKLPDRITLDRAKAARRVSATAQTKAGAPDAQYDLKPRQIDALNALNESGEYQDIMGTIRRGISNIMLEKRLETVLRQVNQDIKDQGAVTLTTLDTFAKLFKEIEAGVSEAKNIDTVDGVLFYAAR
ncbi:MAG: DEAD/DEAH box helicase family protein [Treponematales bacterium]